MRYSIPPRRSSSRTLVLALASTTSRGVPLRVRAGRLFREGLRNTGYETVSLFITVRLSLRRAALPLRTQPFKALLALLRFLPLPALRPSSTCTLALSRSFTRLPSTYLRVPQCLSWGGRGRGVQSPPGVITNVFPPRFFDIICDAPTLVLVLLLLLLLLSFVFSLSVRHPTCPHVLSPTARRSTGFR